MWPFTRDPDIIDVWGHKFKWTPNHLSAEQCDALQASQDDLADRVLERLLALSDPNATSGGVDNAGPERVRHRTHHAKSPATTTASYGSTTENETTDQPSADDQKKDNHRKCPSRDFLSQLRANVTNDPVLTEFWRQVNTVPDWVDWAQIERGQTVYYRYGAANGAGLIYGSLLGGLSASRVVETLNRSGGHSPKVVRERIFETAQWVLQVMRTPEAMRPGEEGWESTVRVRLLHAMVRKRIMDLTRKRPDYYSVAENGVPINDLHSLGTITSFSSSLVWRSLPKQGIRLREQEIKDYIALWRYIGHVIGCPVDPWFETPARAKATFESIMLRETLAPSKASCILADNMVECLVGRPPTYPSRGLILASARWLNGNALCDALGLERTSVYNWTIVAGHTLLIATFAYIYQFFPSRDAAHVALMKRGLWALVVESEAGLGGRPAEFEFKHLPAIDQMTVGVSEADKNGIVRVRRRSIEIISLLTLGLATTVLGTTAWLTSRVVTVAIGGISFR